MSKELEALEKMGCATLEEDLSVRDIYEDEYNVVEQGLQRLEAIDNSNPSEALECLERLGGVEISHTKQERDEDFNGDWVYDTVTVDDGSIEDLYYEDFNIIKQYILKAQELEKELAEEKKINKELQDELAYEIQMRKEGA